jgi:ribonuclease P protein component
LKKENIVRKNYEFSKIIEKNNKVQSKNFIIYIQENLLNKNRYGISVGKKIGNAVTRNKIKRQIRNIIDYLHKKEYQNSYDCIIIIKKGILGIEFNIIKEELTELLIKANILRRR